MKKLVVQDGNDPKGLVRATAGGTVGILNNILGYKI